jgi:hypothetical protein
MAHDNEGCSLEDPGGLSPYDVIASERSNLGVAIDSSQRGVIASAAKQSDGSVALLGMTV